MAETSLMLELGTPAPAFDLESLGGSRFATSDAAGKPMLVMFLCNHCPYVKHVEDEVGRLGAEYSEKGVAVVGVQSNDVASYPDDGPDGMRDQVERAGFTFPYLIDDTQEAAKAYRAACTPDFFLFDADHKLYYRGRMDESRPGSGEPTGEDLRAALDAVLAGAEAPSGQLPSMGCSIKWKPGNEPS
jgi:thiol-disulfide isomerase/thioredoxin